MSNRFSLIGLYPCHISTSHQLKVFLTSYQYFQFFLFQQDNGEKLKHANEFSISVLPVYYKQKKTSFKKGYDLFARVLILEEIVYAHCFDKR